VKVLLTGGRGFVGGWLTTELENTRHEVVAPAREALDVTDADAVRRAIREQRPAAIVHLAAIALAGAAREEPVEAFRIAAGGTANLLEAVREQPTPPAVLVISSSEVYGKPREGELPLREGSPLRATTPYALSKLAQESVALAYAARWGLPLVVVRPFNHTGPGQRPGFVVADLVGRVRSVVRGEADAVRAGNLDVRRDFSDVRDVVRAYRLLLEAMSNGRVEPGGAVLNVASGRAVEIRYLLDRICALAGVSPAVEVDPSLVRPDEAPEIHGDSEPLRALTGWQPEHEIEETLRDIWATADASSS
jgi:GDP-4-dehydro-6-deoxy-D-mannose reductase